MSGDNEMIERVALAIYRAASPWSPIPRKGEIPRQWIDEARAAIAAMREPSARMTESGGIVVGSKEFEHIRSDPTGYGVMYAAEMVWRAMVDSILQGDRGT